jgi:TrmH family RNA methyltransferase
MPNLRIVLVEPREGGNVGAVARAMKNFGWRDLTIVGEPPPLHPVAEWWASGADDVVREARVVPAILDAVADAHQTVATTSSRGRTMAADLDPAGVRTLFEKLNEDQTLALVFGREDRGLTREEAAFCHHTAVIPTSGDFPTMNLAQSVAIFSYALSAAKPSPAGVDLAEAGLVERLHGNVQALLLEVGFLHPDNPDRIYEEVRALIGRMALTEREATLLLGMVRQIEWKLGSGSRER